MKKKPIDIVLDAYNAEELEREKRARIARPILTRWLVELKDLDARIEQHENDIATIEKQKMSLLNKVSEILDDAMLSKFELPNGYGVKPDNKFEIKITSTSDFLKWLKTNKSSGEVLTLLDSALKLGEIKKFCEREFNKAKSEGEFTTHIDGIEFGEMTFRKLKTYTKKGSKK